jgi:hypothetical protein
MAEDKSHEVTLTDEPDANPAKTVVTITMNQLTGQIDVSGPVDKPVVFLGMLDTARMACQMQVTRKKKHISGPVPLGMIEFIDKNKRA